ncbi:hypothetical protein, partial [uncultured Pseudoflavonifractor sp.]|uniref:hypothetical protein n=1 Tax=uncultured Pseudoflavonifractor sp. TaxID=1221379 RepID=UPI0025E1089F
CRDFILPEICKPCLFFFLRNLFYLIDLRGIPLFILLFIHGPAPAPSEMGQGLGDIKNGAAVLSDSGPLQAEITSSG